MLFYKTPYFTVVSMLVSQILCKSYILINFKTRIESQLIRQWKVTVKIQQVRKTSGKQILIFKIIVKLNTNVVPMKRFKNVTFHTLSGL